MSKVKPTTPTSVLLEMEADALLRANGSADLVRNFDVENNDTGPLTPYGNTARHPPAGRIYDPKGDKRIAKTVGLACPQCGRPKSKFSTSPAALCRPCYSEKAIARADLKIKDKYERLEKHIDRYSYAVDAAIEYLMFKERYQEDFAPYLLDQIDELENQWGMPFVHLSGWLSECQADAEEEYTHAREMQEPIE